MNTEHSTPGPLMLDLQGPEITTDEQQLLTSPAVGGVILFTRNYRSPAQLSELMAAIRDANDALLVAVDQEGGRVQRFREGFSRLPPLYHIGQLYQQDPERGLELAHQAAWLMAAELLQYGIDLSFAPVLDLYWSESRVIGDRAFAASPAEVTALARAYINGLHEAGMCATGKHYPGHGSVEADSHVELPRDRREPAQILGHDYRVFADCCDLLDGIMPAHVIYPKVDGLCAGFSKVWLQEKLRQELEFDGVIFSDDLTMEAATTVGGIEARLGAALEAGCDMVLVCNDPNCARQANDWLLAREIRGSKRLSGLRALPAAEISDLKNSEKWQSASTALAEMYSMNEDFEWKS